MRLRALSISLALSVLVVAGQTPSGLASSMQLVGGGLIGSPITGKTINSPSDFGFAVTPDGGTFVCSMAGPLTGGFMHMKVMTVEGPVTKGSLSLHGNTATFKGNATVILAPGMQKEPVEILAGVPFTVTIGMGGPGKGWLMMQVPQFTKTLGGDTGGMVKLGSIATEK